MSNLLINHNGGPVYGYAVPHTGLKVYHPLASAKLLIFTNSSDYPMFLAIKNSEDGTTCQAEVNKGIYLRAQGGSYEMNNMNMGYAEVWAIHDDTGSTHNLCVQVCT